MVDGHVGKENRYGLIVIADIDIVDLGLHSRPGHSHGGLVKRPGGVHDHVRFPDGGHQTRMIVDVNFFQGHFRTGLQFVLHPRGVDVDIAERDRGDRLLLDEIPGDPLTHPACSAYDQCLHGSS